MNIGRKIYYDNRTGEVIQETGERSGDVIETTTSQDFEAYMSLKERDPLTVGVLLLEYGQYSQDFAEGILERVNQENQQLFFRYPDPAEPGGVTEIQESLTEQIKTLRVTQELMQQAIDSLILGGAL